LDLRFGVISGKKMCIRNLTWFGGLEMDTDHNMDVCSVVFKAVNIE